MAQIKCVQRRSAASRPLLETAQQLREAIRQHADGTIADVQHLHVFKDGEKCNCGMTWKQYVEEPDMRQMCPAWLPQAVPTQAELFQIISRRVRPYRDVHEVCEGEYEERVVLKYSSQMRKLKQRISGLGYLRPDDGAPE